MGYRGKVREREQARELRAQGLTMNEIAQRLDVSKSSVSLWTRDVAFVARPRKNRNYGARRRKPNVLQLRKLAEIQTCNRHGKEKVGTLTDREFLLAGLALYAGEGFKNDGCVGFANTDADQIRFFVRWLRRFFTVDESRLRVRLYLHEGLDLDAAQRFWSDLTAIPLDQFRKAYRARADATRRRTKHIRGCPAVTYSCSLTHRQIMGLLRALLDLDAIPG